MMKNQITILLLLLVLAAGCKKTETLNFEFDSSQDYVSNELDKWLETTFLDPYNIEVIYRYDRYKGNIERNIAPVKEDKVKAQMEVVLDGFLKPYGDIVSKEFIKSFTPKEWVLFGSTSYNNDGSMILGTASGGRNITLYEVNALVNSDSEQVRRRLRTIHHEFTHTLQQNKQMPLDFEGISEGDYFDDWTNNTLNPATLSDSLGFVSRYARSQYFEDFAETSAHLLIQGQLWYDNHALKYNETTYSRLKRKESSVVKYFKDNFDIDFRSLQRELSYVLYDEFNDKYFQSFGKWFLEEELFNNVVTYNSFEVSDDFKSAVDQFKADVLAYSATNKYEVQDLIFTFNPKNETMIIRVPFKATSGSSVGSVYNADYNFAYSYTGSTAKVKFTKVAQGEGAVYNNANLFLNSFMTNVSEYLTSDVFIADWSIINSELNRRDESFFNTGGFYKEDDKGSFISFPLIRRTK